MFAVFYIQVTSVFKMTVFLYINIFSAQVKFCTNVSYAWNHIIAVEMNVKIAAAIILDLLGSKFWRQICFRDIESHDSHAKFHANISNSYRVSCPNQLQNGGHHHLEFCWMYV